MWPALNEKLEKNKKNEKNRKDKNDKEPGVYFGALRDPLWEGEVQMDRSIAFGIDEREARILHELGLSSNGSAASEATKPSPIHQLELYPPNPAATQRARVTEGTLI